MLKKVFVFVAASVFLYSGVLYASDVCTGCVDTISKLFKSSKIGDIDKITDGPLYQVVVNDKIAYTDGKRYIFMGVALDITTGQNITQAKFDEINKLDFNSFDLTKSILVKGSGNNQKKILIFHDVDCPFCKKLVGEIPAIYSDTDVYVYLFPLTSIHPGAFQKSVSIWCSKNRKEALDMVTNGENIPNTQCENPVQDIIGIAEKLGLSGTPVIFFSNGKRNNGYIPAEGINSFFSAN